MPLYHRTDHAEAILRDGLEDAEGSYLMAGITLRGVWVSNRPLDINEGADGEDLPVVTVPDDLDVDYYEVIEDGKPYREWCVPARVLNEQGSVRLQEG